jgi:aspartate/methionine/tyrosine aminotransferase
MAGAIRFLKEGTGNLYGPVQGDPRLLALLAEKLTRENGVECGDGTGRVIVTAGANMGFLHAILAISDPGDEVILPVPYYFNHEMAIRLANAVPVPVPTDAHYHLVPEYLEAAITPRTRAIVTVSPNNPSGAVYSHAELAAVSALCRDHGIYHLHDHAYEYFTYLPGPEACPGALPGSAPYTISLFSLSKAYGFAAYRLGYMVLPEPLFPEVMKIQDTNLICPPLISQYAAMGVLEAGSGYCRGRIRGISEVRDHVVQALAGLGALLEQPPGSEGAIYVLLRVRSALAPMTLVERLIANHRVAVLPGTAFGLNEGCTLRVSFGSLAPATVAEGIGRLKEGLSALAG